MSDEKKVAKALAKMMEEKPVDLFRRSIVAWNHLCANPYVYGEDKEAVLRLVIAEGERNRWIVWDETIMQYVFVPEQLPLSEVKSAD